MHQSDLEAHEFARLRHEMVEGQLVSRDIDDPRVIEAMRTIPRELFVTGSMQSHAYEDRALSTEFGQTISQPYIVAYMSQALDIEQEHAILEIGTGTGYQTAILASLADRVFTVERIASLSESARGRLESLGIRNVEYLVDDGSLGWPEHAPYDRILVTASAPNVTEALTRQLNDPGRLVLPVGQDESQIITIVEKTVGVLVERPTIPVRFVKLIGREGFSE